MKRNQRKTRRLAVRLQNWFDSGEPACEVCGYFFAEKHRLKPGRWGGTYDPENVVWLCPNHHTGIHLLMKWYHCCASLSATEARRLELTYGSEPALRRLFFARVKPIIVQRMTEEGRRHPYRHTLT